MTAADVPPLAATVASFDARSAHYDDSLMHRYVADHAVAALDARDGLTLLDLAGGTGLVARAALPRLGGTGQAVVLDASPGMLAEARRQDARLHLVRADAHRVPLRSASVDRIACVTALHLFHDPEQALREVARTCRPEGRVARVASTGPLRRTPGAISDRVRQLFEQQLPAELEHVLLLVTCRPQTSSPSR